MRLLFHVGCSLVLAASIWLSATAGRDAPRGGDAKAQFLRFITASGYEVSNERRIIGDEISIEIKDPACPLPHEVLFVPAIHRISDRIHAIVAARPQAVIVHDGEKIPSLAAMTLIPRWMIGRIMVNAQLADEDPWISIVLIVLTPVGCDSLKLQWNRLASA